MKILLISTEQEDYLQDSIIHGLKELLGTTAFEYPIKNMLYDDFKEMHSIRGNGFTLYGLISHSLKSSPSGEIEELIKNNAFDLIVFTSIFRQYSLFYKLYPYLKKQKEKVWIVDGEDTDVLFPYLGGFLKKPFFWLSARPHKHFKYFKRELTLNTIRSYYYRLISFSIASKIGFHKNLHSISFSIPQVKIVKAIPKKTKMFTQHIVDEEILKNMKGKSNNYAFSVEEDYYADIQESKYGVTTKRAGWDCLRHYEIAANGAVICFKNLEQKPPLCAPHGLIAGYNCISYSGYQDLMNKINSQTDADYNIMLSNSLVWINQNTTTERAKQLLTLK